MSTQLPSFDVLMDLARNDPDQLEAIRKDLSDEVIRKAPSPEIRQRLEGLNFKITMERQRSKNPMQSCIRLTNLMHDAFDRMRIGLDTLLHDPDAEAALPTLRHPHSRWPGATLERPPAQTADNIIPLADYRSKKPI